MSTAMRAVRVGPTGQHMEHAADGTLHVRPTQALDSYPQRLTEHLEHWARTTPRQVLFAEREPGGGWRRVTYAEALDMARRIGAALLARGLSAERPVVVLSGNDIEHALLELGALMVGVPYAPLSPAYSLLSGDHAKLRAIFDLLTPGLVFAADGAQFARAIDAVVPRELEAIATRNVPVGRAATAFDALLQADDGAAVDAAHARVGPDTIAKFLFTSGSTGAPKAVINTQRMWCANQQMLRQMLAFVTDEPPVLVGWAPWHHTAAGNHDFGLALTNGGSYYLDAGKPMPGAIEATVQNLREIAPTWYFNVPKGFEALLPHLRADTALRRNFFSRVKMLWFAGAGLAQHVFDEYKVLALETCGEEILFGTGFGSTETAPLTLARTWDAGDASNLGVPPPGVELKLVPFEGKHELRVRGPHITPGYWRAPELTAQAFDEEGWYRMGDAFVLADGQDASRGLLFRGRVAEDFKLATGTWVHVGPLRAEVVAQFAPLARDIVIAGAQRDDLTALVFPDVEACRALAPDLAADAAVTALCAHEAVRDAFARRLAAHRRAATGSSNRIERIVLAVEPPQLDAGEATDKGSINQRAVLARRATLVEMLYAEPPGADVIRAAG